MTEKSHADWQALADALRIDGRALINGERVDALSGQTRTTYNPATGAALVDVASCGP